MLQIVGEDTLIRQTLRRVIGFVPPENIWIVTTQDKAADIRFGELSKQFRFVEEPMGRNTAPAIGLTAIYLRRLDPESVMAVMPSDHAILETDKFLSDLRIAVEGAEKEYLVTFGIKPSRPETGYGYIRFDKDAKIGLDGIFKVERFVEKPDLETAKIYLTNGHYFWNSGIFVWKTSKILSEIATHLPQLYRVLTEIDKLSKLSELSQLSGEKDKTPSSDLLGLERNSLLNSLNQLDSLNSLYSSLESISIDYGVMERSSDVLMVPATFHWSDVGNWTALDEILEKDSSGNIRKGNTIDVGSRRSIIFAGERVVATIGLDNMVVVDTPDATLVAHKEKVQEVRKVVEELKRKDREEYLLHKTVERPWGSYTVLEKGQGYKIKRVYLKPGARLSLQLHRRRSEHWVVVEGTAKFAREDEVFLVEKGQSTFIPVNSKHRLENPGPGPLQIIEVQNGEYLEEDDIERFEDDYGRR